jgi:hypothetical protein
MSDIRDITNLEVQRDSGIGSLKNVIPANIRMFVADLLGSKEPFTEKDLKLSDRELLKKIASSSKDKGYIDYADYGVNSIDRSILKNILDDRYNLKTLLGKAKVEVDPQGNLIVKDTFDFNDKKDVKNLEDFKFALKDITDAYKGNSGYGKGGIYSMLRQVGKYFGSGPGEGAPVEINLGKYENI